MNAAHCPLCMVWIKKTKLNENKKRIIPSKACNPVQAHVIRRNNVLFTQKCVLSYAKTSYLMHKRVKGAGGGSSGNFFRNRLFGCF